MVIGGFHLASAKHFLIAAIVVSGYALIAVAAIAAAIELWNAYGAGVIAATCAADEQNFPQVCVRNWAASLAPTIAAVLSVLVAIWALMLARRQHDQLIDNQQREQAIAFLEAVQDLHLVVFGLWRGLQDFMLKSRNDKDSALELRKMMLEASETIDRAVARLERTRLTIMIGVDFNAHFGEMNKALNGVNQCIAKSTVDIVEDLSNLMKYGRPLSAEARIVPNYLTLLNASVVEIDAAVKKTQTVTESALERYEERRRGR